eukprot:5687019-Amphidinium_carterae.1
MATETVESTTDRLVQVGASRSVGKCRKPETATATTLHNAALVKALCSPQVQITRSASMGFGFKMLR